MTGWIPVREETDVQLDGSRIRLHIFKCCWFLKLCITSVTCSFFLRVQMKLEQTNAAKNNLLLISSIVTTFSVPTRKRTVPNPKVLHGVWLWEELRLVRTALLLGWLRDITWTGLSGRSLPQRGQQASGPLLTCPETVGPFSAGRPGRTGPSQTPGRETRHWRSLWTDLAETHLHEEQQFWTKRNINDAVDVNWAPDPHPPVRMMLGTFWGPSPLP